VGEVINGEIRLLGINEGYLRERRIRKKGRTWKRILFFLFEYL
jgi:hypothetical protein